ncbi:helix-turn-helix domain-containing protein [Exilibacterium tricleocarpae]|uniref:Helix-turn-helix domain-containing protein n=1 Tax=Exilibacterium tricleocarpae TaxID=2591008 RepID=A0A545TNT0_9GAMM|nr:substrate-binding domain-containing protein [Exilibacterium tricleocarpae]TQV78821.1 helix-turn-helix domain-containing protein [Exilibacterium tricleocarpae]
MTTAKHLNVLLALSRYDHRTHKGVAQFAAKHNWHLNCEMAITGRPPGNWRGDGILALLTEDQEVVDYVLGAQVPFVDISVIRRDIAAPRVCADNNRIGSLAAEYYLDKGFRHFAFFSTTSDRVSQLRRDSFFATAGSRAHSTVDWSIPAPSRSGNLNRTLTDHLRSNPQPLALFAARDIDASMVLDACIQAEVDVPNQIAILGVDNNELITNSLRVPLSSVNHDVEALGYAGAQLLQGIMVAAGGHRHNTETPRLIPPKGITSRLSTDCLAVTQPLVRTALQQLNRHFSNCHYTVVQAAEHCRVTRRHLDALFNAELGHSMHAELTGIRLRAAKRALVTSNDTVAQISAACGFARPQYFNNSFRKIVAETPLGYRRRNR